MNIIKYICALTFSITITAGIQAQTIEDALRYSVLNPTGTAALMGIGGAGGAIGGDYSTLHINPAGLAEFKKSKFVFTPVISTYSSESSIDNIPGNLVSDRKSRFGIGNIGFVNVNRNDNGASSIKNFNIAIGFSKMADFNNAIYVQGSNAGSILDYFVVNANSEGQGNLDAFSTQLASEAGALIYDDFESEYYSDLDGVDINQPIAKEQTITRSGGINELNLSMAGNVNNKLNFGFHLGMPFVNFDETKIYREVGPGSDISAFQAIEQTERLSTSGVGINFKTGIQYKIVPSVRIGAAIHSPSYFTLTEDFSTSVQYSYLDNSSVLEATGASPDGSFRYRVTNPWRGIISAATVYKIGVLKGFLSGDIEFADYTSTSFNLTAYSDDPLDASFGSTLNRDIKNTLASTVNYRIGTEIGYENLRLRGGLGLNQSPYSLDEKTYNKTFSLGLGLRVESFFVDIAYKRSTDSQGYYPYFNESEDFENTFVNVDSKISNIAITTGFSF